MNAGRGEGVAKPRVIVGSDGRAKAYRPLAAGARRSAREAGIAAYEAGRFWHAHELMEPAWMGSNAPAERDLDQGLIKLAAAYVHAERGNAEGMRKNLSGARRRLAAVIGEHGAAGVRAAAGAQVDAERLFGDVEGTLERLQQYLERRSGEHWARRGSESSEGPVDRQLLVLFPPPRIARTRETRS